jgi:hypothetical protein
MRSSVSKSAEQGTKGQQKRVIGTRKGLKPTPTTMWGLICFRADPKTKRLAKANWPARLAFSAAC